VDKKAIIELSLFFGDILRLLMRIKEDRARKIVLGENGSQIKFPPCLVQKNFRL
jgi:hypothetical protein